MNILAFVFSALTGVNGSSTGATSSMRLEGIIATVASLLVYLALQKGVHIAPEDATAQVTAVFGAGASIWYAIGSLRAVVLWAKEKWASRQLPS